MRGQLRVRLGNVDRFCILRGPLFEGLDRPRLQDRGQYTFGMARPRPLRTIAVDPRVDPDRAFAGLPPCADDDLHG